MQAHDAHGHDPHGHGGHGAHAGGSDPHGCQAACDPDFGRWLLASLLFLAALSAVYLLPARHAAGPLLPDRSPAATGHATGAHDGAPAGGAQGHAPAGDAARRERERIAQVFGAMAGLGLADDTVPPEVRQEVEYLIGLVAESEASFLLDLEPRTPGETAAWMLERWQRLQGEIYSAEAFMVRSLGRKLIDDKVHRIRLPDGSDRPLRTWLQERLDAYRLAR